MKPVIDKQLSNTLDIPIHDHDELYSNLSE